MAEYARNASQPDDDDCIVMVRHTAVSEDLKGVCYGVSNVVLSEAGLKHIEDLADELASAQPSIIMHSGLTRARLLAEAVASRLDLPPTTDARLAEFNFGAWELRTWDDIYHDGYDIARVVKEPATFAPPGGETLHAMRDRVRSWYDELSCRSAGRVLAISHGGPISSLYGSLQGLPETAWPSHVPAFGGQVRFARRKG